MPSALRPGRMKAVSMIFEFALLFMFGIIIFISSVSVFNNYQSHFNDVTAQDQLSKVGEYLNSNIVKLSEMQSGEDASLSVKIPKEVGNERYTIELSAEGLVLTSATTKISQRSALFNLSQSFSLSGKTTSGAGTVIIYKTGNQIILS